MFLSSSSLLNLVNNLLIFSGLIPLPVSSTDITNLEIFLVLIQLTSNSIIPFSVYLQASKHFSNKL